MLAIQDEAEAVTRQWINANVDRAVARRFREIAPRLHRRFDPNERAGGYVYENSRTRPENLGFRVRQSMLRGGLQAAAPADWPRRIAAGELDDRIEAAWHDAASAAWYYLYEKDYGRD